MTGFSDIVQFSDSEF